MFESLSVHDSTPPSEPHKKSTAAPDATESENGSHLSPSAILAIVGAIETLTERIETVEERVIEALPVLSQHVDRLNGSVASMKTHADQSGGSLERAVMRLSARVQELEASTGGANRIKTLLSRRRRA